MPLKEALILDVTNDPLMVAAVTVMPQCPGAWTCAHEVHASAQSELSIQMTWDGMYWHSSGIWWIVAVKRGISGGQRNGHPVPGGQPLAHRGIAVGERPVRPDRKSCPRDGLELGADESGQPTEGWVCHWNQRANPRSLSFFPFQTTVRRCKQGLPTWPDRCSAAGDTAAQQASEAERMKKLWREGCFCIAAKGRSEQQVRRGGACGMWDDSHRERPELPVRRRKRPD